MMGAGRVGGWLGVAVLVGVLLAAAEPTAWAQGGNSEALNAQVIKLYGEGKYAEAIPIAQRVLAMQEKAGTDHIDFANSLNNLALLYKSLGRYADAEPLYRRDIAISEKALGRDHPHVAISLSNLAVLLQLQGHYIEAEALYKRSLAIVETALGADHPDVAASLNTLAGLYQLQGRYSEAEPLYKRSIAVREIALGPDHSDVAASLNDLGVLYKSQNRYADAEVLYKRSLHIRESVLGPDHPDVGVSLNNLAGLYQSQGRYGDAEPLYKRDIAISEKALGPNHPDHGISLNNLAKLYESQGRYGDAERLYQRAASIFAKALGPDHPDVGTALNNLAWLALTQSDWTRAAEQWRASTAIIQRRAVRGLGGGELASSRNEAQRSSWEFLGLVKMTRRLAAAGPDEQAHRAAEMFETAQWGQGSEAAAALAQMAARSAKDSPKLAALVRERQDLVAEWQGKDKLLIAAKSEAPDRRNRKVEKDAADRLSAIDTRLAAIDARFKKAFPNYAALANPKPLSIIDVQSQLRDGEALVLFLDTPEWEPVPEETFIWAVTRTDARWTSIPLGTAALRERVERLRCGLDSGAWGGDGLARCNTLLGRDAKTPRPRALPFDPVRAHELYKSLFGEIEDLIKDKHLLVVPSGPLQQLPLHVLVTDPPANGAPTAWLARRHAITALPSVASLKALRAHTRSAVAARKPYLAFANPLIEGREGNANASRGAARAAASTDCTAVAQLQEMSASAEEFAAWQALETTLGGGVDVGEIRKLAPVPETAKLACDVAKAVGADEDDIHLGARATEAKVKAMNASGALASYAVVNFTTHGMIAGQLTTSAEPGLVLTPPETGTEEDDGYLSASEVAGLKLDADWVILSACNTAAGGAANAEALSGLARTFFYAGARALLVSHWSVREDAAVALVTKALAATAADKSLGRAEALRRAMIALADSADPKVAHPAYWAPFVVVGEGGATLH